MYCKGFYSQCHYHRIVMKRTCGSIYEAILFDDNTKIETIFVQKYHERCWSVICFGLVKNEGNKVYSRKDILKEKVKSWRWSQSLHDLNLVVHQIEAG